jgi:hypothetical protein
VPKFITTDRVAVSDDAGNTVYLRRKMDAGARLRTAEASTKGEALLTLYVTNILAWEGPDFKGIKCTPENIERMDMDDPFWERVGDKISELNPQLRGGDPDPLASTTDGVLSTPESSTTPEDSSISK